MYYESNELSHHGVKGMKWGVRKARRQMASVTKRKKSDITDDEALQFKKDVKDARKNRLRSDVDGDYANAVYKQVRRNRVSKVVAGSLAAIGGTAIASTSLINKIDLGEVTTMAMTATFALPLMAANKIING